MFRACKQLQQRQWQQTEPSSAWKSDFEDPQSRILTCSSSSANREWSASIYSTFLGLSIWNNRTHHLPEKTNTKMKQLGGNKDTKTNELTFFFYAAVEPPSRIWNCPRRALANMNATVAKLHDCCKIGTSRYADERKEEAIWYSNSKNRINKLVDL